MSSTRGEKNILSYNEKRKEKYIELIKDAIEECRRKKVFFDDIAPFSGYIEKETGIRRSNLTRNATYRKMLQVYIDEFSDGPAITLHDAHAIYTDENAPPQILRGWLLEERLANSNLAEKLKQAQIVSKKKAARRLSFENSDSDNSSSGDYYNEFVDTAMALLSVLTRHQEILKLDLEMKSIVDESSRPSERIVVGPTRLAPFIKWLETKEEFLLKFMPPND